MICFSSFILTLFGIGLSKYSFKQDILHGRMNQSLQSRYDLAQMILVRLPKESERDKAINQPTKLMELLSTVYARKITPDAKLKKLADMGISVTDEDGERINTMCNLSEGIFEEGRKRGWRKQNGRELSLKSSAHGLMSCSLRMTNLQGLPLTRRQK